MAVHYVGKLVDGTEVRSRRPGASDVALQQHVSATTCLQQLMWCVVVLALLGCQHLQACLWAKALQSLVGECPALFCMVPHLTLTSTCYTDHPPYTLPVACKLTTFCCCVVHACQFAHLSMIDLMSTV